MGSAVLKSEKLRALLSENIRSLLEENDWSENELARRSGVSQKQVNNIAQERTGCGIDALDSMARAFRVEPWQLLLEQLPKIRENPSKPARVLRAYILMEPAEQLTAEHLILRRAK